MSQRRKLLLILMIIPIIMVIMSIGWPDEGLELVYLVVGVPILVLNAWEYFDPEVIDLYFGKSKIRDNKLSSNKLEALMRNKFIIVLIVFSSVLILSIIGYSFLRSSIDKVPFLFALFTLLTKLASKTWHFLTEPIIFISSLLFIMLWLFRKPIIMFIPEIKGINGIKFPDNFSQSFITPIPENLSTKNKIGSGKGNVPETNPVFAWYIEHGPDKKVVQLLLDIDGKDITKSEVLSKIDHLGINYEILPPHTQSLLKESFYRGTFETLYDYVLPIFCNIERKNKDTVACFTLLPGVRERLVEIVPGQVGVIQLEADHPQD